MWRKTQLTFILTCFANYDFFVDFFFVTNQANHQDYSGIYNWGRHCISWSYTRTTRFLYLRTAFGHLSRGNFCQSMSVFNKPCCLWSFSSQGTVGFHLSPFTDLLLSQGFRPEGEIPRRHPIDSRAYLRKVLTVEIYSHTVNTEKISICLKRGREE